MKKEYIEEKIGLYKLKKKYLMETWCNDKKVNFHKNIHHFLAFLLSVKRTVIGQRIHVINDKSKVEKDKPVIYAITHIGKYDYEMVFETLKNGFYTLAGDWEIMYGTIDDYFFRTAGVIYVDTEDKEDRKKTYELNVQVLKHGMSLLWFPEGIWNLTQNLPMLNLYPGIINAAKEASVEIVPIAIDQTEKDFYINIGKNINVDDLEDDKSKSLRDVMATLKWEIWEAIGTFKREDIPDDYYEQFLKLRISEWPQFNMEIINDRKYKDKNVVSEDEVFKFMDNMEFNIDNAFLLGHGKRYIKRKEK